MTKFFPKFPKVEVFWEDASSICGWHAPDDPRRAGFLAVRTVGYLVRQDRKGVSLAMSVNEEGQLGCELEIPRQWVLKVIKEKRSYARSK